MTLEQLQELATERTEQLIGAWNWDKDGNPMPIGLSKLMVDQYRKAYLDIQKELKAIKKKFTQVVRLRVVVALIIGGLSGHSASAAEVRRLEVQKNGPTIAVEAEIVIEAPTPQVFKALADYSEFADLSSAYLESRYLEPDVDGTSRVYTKIRGCILFFW